jgi:hypothetical protein
LVRDRRALQRSNTDAAADKPDQCGTEDDDGKRYTEKENADESGGGQPNQQLALEGSLANAHRGLDDNGQHGRLQTEE